MRFGFQFEGIFLNHRVVKGRNRDTAWFAITDQRWPADTRRLRELAERRRTSTPTATSARA